MGDFSENIKGANLNLSTKGGGFLQSYEWEKFQQAIGRKTWRIQDILLIKHEMPFGFNYLYCPRPEMENIDGDRTIKSAIADFRDLGLKEKSIFVKLEPEIADAGYFCDLGFIKSTKEIQPSETIIIDLAQSEQEILERMHEKTRYNIRLAQKHGIEIRELGDGFDPVWKMFKETAERDKFFLHSGSYYEKMVEVLKPAGLLKIFGAFHKNALVAANIMVFYPPPLEDLSSKGGGRATYLHGASVHAQRNLMAPYALHWHLIQEAKRNGFREYDFWGVSEKKYPGVTRFKKGFGGKEVGYPGSFDYIFSYFWYNAYRIGSKVKSRF